MMAGQRPDDPFRQGLVLAGLMVVAIITSIPFWWYAASL